MKFISLIIYFSSYLNIYAQNELNRFYIGIKEVDFKELGEWERQTIKTKDPQRKFYNVSHLKIFNDSVFLDQFAITVFQGDTIVLPNDGIYHFFDGNVFRTNDSTVLFKLNEVVVNYFEQTFEINKSGLPIVVRRNNDFPGKLQENDLVINNIRFQRSFQTRDLISEYSEIFENLKNQNIHTHIRLLPLNWRKE